MGDITSHQNIYTSTSASVSQCHVCHKLPVLWPPWLHEAGDSGRVSQLFSFFCFFFFFYSKGKADPPG